MKIKSIAIDGTSGSGKSTLAKALAKKFGLEHLDTGAMYRAVACAVLRAGIDPADEKATAKVSRSSKIEIRANQVLLNGADITAEIRSREVTQIVSTIAANPEVRKHQRKKQRRWIKKRKGGVLEGRDIGTAVLPKAHLKIYISAEPEIRAERRAKESGRSKEEVLASMRERDRQDSEREFNPLKKPADAIEVDTSGKAVEEVLTEILKQQQARVEAYLSEDKNLLAGKNVAERKIFYDIIFTYPIRAFARIIFRTYFRGRIYNRKNIPKKGAVILAPAGHRSNLDAPLIGLIATRVLWYMAKDSLFHKSRFWSRFFYNVGGFPVKRDELDRNAMRTATQVLENGGALLIFPEGMRQEGPTVQPLLGGVIWIAAKTNTPILPIGLAGGDNAMPIGRHIPSSKKIVAVIGELHPAPPKRMSRKARDKKTDELRAELQVLFDKAKKLVGT